MTELVVWTELVDCPADDALRVVVVKAYPPEEGGLSHDALGRNVVYSWVCLLCGSAPYADAIVPARARGRIDAEVSGAWRLGGFQSVADLLAANHSSPVWRGAALERLRTKWYWMDRHFDVYPVEVGEKWL